MLKKRFILIAIMCGMLFVPAIAEDLGEITLDELDTLDVTETREQPKPRIMVKNVEVPKWEEFCESGYENAHLREKKNILNVINFVDAEQTKSNYWAQRRENFEKAINHCNTLNEDEKNFCYEGVREAELERNEMYEQQRKRINYKNQGIVIDKPNY